MANTRQCGTRPSGDRQGRVQCHDTRIPSPWGGFLMERKQPVGYQKPPSGTSHPPTCPEHSAEQLRDRVTEVDDAGLESKIRALIQRAAGSTADASPRVRAEGREHSASACACANADRTLLAVEKDEGMQQKQPRSRRTSSRSERTHRHTTPREEQRWRL